MATGYLRCWAGLVACVVLLAVAACTSGSGGSEEPDASADLATFYDQDLVWTGCYRMRGECAGADVPVDYVEPDGETVSLSLRRIPARGQARGSLLFNPGGPGVSGVTALSGYVRGLPDEIRDHYDIVGFDPRGIADSDGLDCTGGADRRADRIPDWTPDSTEEERELIVWYKRHDRSCVEWDSDLVRHMASADVARDLDVLRALVGDERLNYVGVSYGTVIGADYVELFPERVGRVVLDSPVDQTRSESDLMLGEVRAHAWVLRAYLRDCVRRGCPLGGTVSKARTGLDRLLSRLDDHPISAGSRRRLTENDARAAIEFALAGSTWEALTKGIRAASEGNGRPLYRMARYWYGTAPSVQRLSVEGNATRCSDSQQRLDEGEVRRLAHRLHRESAIFGDDFAWAQTGCGQWTLPPAEPLDVDGSGADPVLVVGSVGDPITPYRQSRAIAKQLDSAVLLTSQTYGHGAYAMGHGCVDRAVDAYLLTGDPPKDGKMC